MIRPITADDTPSIVALAVDAGLFAAEDSPFLEKMMADYFSIKQAEDHRCVIAREHGDPVGVAYYEPALATDRTWYLTMIAVRRGVQGTGRGSALMRHVEDALRAEGQRVLLVETSGAPGFAHTRRFYVKLGYEQEAHVRDYFADGDDMILFRKRL